MPSKKKSKSGTKATGNSNDESEATITRNSSDEALTTMQQFMMMMTEQMCDELERQDRQMRELMEQMRQDRLQQERQLRNEREKDQDHMEQFMTATLDKFASKRKEAVSTVSGNAGTKSKKVDMPILGPVEQTAIADFRTWKETFLGYSNVLKLDSECNLTGRQTMLRTALDPSWAKLWTTHMLDIKPDDDIKEILDCIGNYICKKRNPLLDRLDFYRRDQREHEGIDQYFAELQILYES